MQITEITQEYQALAGTLHAVGGDRFWENVTQFLRRFILFDDLVVLSYPATAAPYCTFHTLDGTRHSVLISDYFAGPYILDPFYTVITQTDRAGAIALREVAPDKFRSTKYYERHYSRTGIVDELGLFIRSQNNHCDVISLLRTGASRRFSAGAVDQFRSRASVLLQMAETHIRSTASSPIEDSSQKRWTFAEALKGDKLSLSPREIEICELILRGHSSLSIALNLGIVEGTVKNHRKSIYRKLGISSQAELFSLFLSRILDQVD